MFGEETRPRAASLLVRRPMASLRWHQTGGCCVNKAQPKELADFDMLIKELHLVPF